MVRVGQVCSMGSVARGVILVTGVGRWGTRVVVEDPITGGVKVVKLVMMEFCIVVIG